MLLLTKKKFKLTEDLGCGQDVGQNDCVPDCNRVDAIVLAEVPSESDFIAVLGNAFMKGMIADSNTFTCVNQDTVMEGFNKMKQVDYAVPGAEVEMA